MAKNPLTLYLFIGYPGAGKTTTALLLKKKTGAYHIWADHERHDLFQNPTHSKTESDNLYHILNQKTARLLAEGISVIFDTNFNFYNDRMYLKNIADHYNAKTLIIWLDTPKEIAKQRVTSNHQHSHKNGYNDVMTEGVFASLSNHLHPPQKNENYIKINGAIEIENQLDNFLYNNH